jgi:hypothetical protein
MAMRNLPAGALLALLIATGGCSGSDGATEVGYRYEGLCDIDSGHPGDRLCLGEPEATDGFQLHYGPANYDDAAEVDRYLLAPSEELTDCLFLTTPNDREVFWSEYHLRARTGTHHIIVYTGSSDEPDGTLGPCNLGQDMRFFVGAQSGIGPEGVVLDVPLPGPQPPENEGYAQRLPPRSRVAFQMHYVNTTKQPILREAWVNFHYEPPEQVKVVMDPIFFIGGLGMDVSPNTHTTVEAHGCTLPEDGPDQFRVVGMTGHMHAHGVRLSAWKVDKDGTRQLVYETFDWEEPLNAQFDSVRRNPSFDSAARRDAAWTGPLTIQKGESLDWECEYRNTLGTPLRFGNQAYTGEMCNVFGWYAPSVGQPWSCYRL